MAGVVARPGGVDVVHQEHGTRRCVGGVGGVVSVHQEGGHRFRGDAIYEARGGCIEMAPLVGVGAHAAGSAGQDAHGPVSIVDHLEACQRAGHLYQRLCQ